MSHSAPTRLRLDHWQLITSRDYMLDRARLLMLPGEVVMTTVLHEHDDRCCRTEPWGRTLRRLLDTDPGGGLG